MIFLEAAGEILLLDDPVAHVLLPTGVDDEQLDSDRRRLGNQGQDILLGHLFPPDAGVRVVDGGHDLAAHVLGVELPLLVPVDVPAHLAETAFGVAPDELRRGESLAGLQGEFEVEVVQAPGDPELLVGIEFGDELPAAAPQQRAEANDAPVFRGVPVVNGKERGMLMPADAGAALEHALAGLHHLAVDHILPAPVAG